MSLGPRREITSNLVVYTAFLAIAVIGILYGNAIKNDYSFLRVWDYLNILILLIGVPFLFLQTKADLPNFLTDQVSSKNRFLTPALIGIGFGILDVLVIKFILHPEPYTELPPFLQPFPYSLFLYFSGALEIELFYRLIPITLILLLGKWVGNGKYYTGFFYAIAILTSLREPLEQFPDGAVWFIGYSLLTGFLMNYLQAIHLRKSGFLASLSVRLGHYLIWHILLGIYVQYIELS